MRPHFGRRTVSQAANATAEIAAAGNFPHMHTYKVAAQTAPAPQRSIHGGGWQVASSASVKIFSAACWFAGRDLQVALQDQNTQVEAVPVALVQASWGGTHIEAWSSSAALAECPGVGTTVCHNPPPSADPQGHNNCSLLWNAMLVTLCPAAHPPAAS